MTTRRRAAAVAGALLLLALVGCGVPGADPSDPGGGEVTGTPDAGSGVGGDPGASPPGGGSAEWTLPLRRTADPAALDSLRTEYVGDASAVIALAGAAGMPEVGAYTIELDTDEEPYRVTFTLAEDDLAMDVGEALISMEHRAVLLLATVDNLDEVVVEVDDGVTGLYLDRAGADELLGSPVVERGRDAGGLRDMIEVLDARVIH